MRERERFNLFLPLNQAPSSVSGCKFVGVLSWSYCVCCLPQNHLSCKFLHKGDVGGGVQLLVDHSKGVVLQSGGMDVWTGRCMC